jgi:hypothetical protein
MPTSTEFSVMNMNTNELYDYKLNKTPSQAGGIFPSLDMKKLEEKMESLERRVKNLEDKNLDKIERTDKIDSVMQRSEKIDKVLDKFDIHRSDRTKEIQRIEAGPTAPVNSDFAKAFL